MSSFAQVTRLAATLGKVGPYVSTGMARAVGAAAAQVEQQARANAPRRSGDLQASITTERRGPRSYSVVAGEFYASFVEYGTAKMAPEPFMVPAAQEAEASIVRAAEALGALHFLQDLG